MKSLLLFLFLIAGAPFALSQVSFCKQWDNFILDDDSVRHNWTQDSWTMGLFLEKPLTEAIPGAPKFLSLAGFGEFGFWAGRGTDSLDVEKSVQTSALLTVTLWDALKIGPGIGILALFGDEWEVPVHTRFPSLFIFSGKIEFPGTPWGIGYRYQSSALGDKPSLKYFSSSIVFFLDISTIFPKPLK